MTTPNLDAMDESDLLAFAKMNRKARKQHTRELAHYADTKASAMQHRSRGNIEAALLYEDLCERIYRRLPEHCRW
jgi:hypothetical protein